MIATTHLAVGAASGLAVQNLLYPDASAGEKVLISFVAGFLSHLVLDAVPHREYTADGLLLWTILAVEIAAVFLCVLSPHNNRLVNLIIFAGMAGGALPDFLGLSYRYFLQWPLLAESGKTMHFFHFCRAPAGLELNYHIQVLIALIAVIFVRSESA